MNLKGIKKKLSDILPEGLVPESYLDYLIDENAEVMETQEEMLAFIKMQLAEETGLNLPMDRKEAEEYVCDDIPDDDWNEISENGLTTTRHVKMLDEAGTRSMLDVLKEMPLIPAAKMIGSLITAYLRDHGQEITPEREEEIAEDMIHMLETPLEEMYGGGDEDWDPDEDEEIDDLDPDIPEEIRNILLEEGEQKPRRRSRSRITPFPGGKK